ncbi:hypothetical protein IJ556_00665 [bacterium]|nr:hypothetical protein [bacterium]MBR2273864.1 hypothetical protein [Alphaproteobacteria bacterium]
MSKHILTVQDFCSVLYENALDFKYPQAEFKKLSDEKISALSLREDLGLDSLDIYDLEIRLLDEFSLIMPLTERPYTKTVGDFLNFLNTKSLCDVE